MGQNDVAGNSNCQDLQNTGRSGVDQHTHKLQTYYDGQHIVQIVADILKISGSGKHPEQFITQRSQQNQNGNQRDETFDPVQDSAKKVFQTVVVLFLFFNTGLQLGVEYSLWCSPNFIIGLLYIKIKKMEIIF